MDVINKDFIVIDAEIVTQKESIDLAEKLFRKRNYVKDGYAKATKNREEKYPTGLQTESMAIAIPHTDPEYANQTAVGCIIPKKPIEFIAMGTPDKSLNCEIIFPIIVNQSKDQVKMLKELMKIFNNSDALYKIKNAQSAEDVLEVLGILNEKVQEFEEV